MLLSTTVKVLIDVREAASMVLLALVTPGLMLALRVAQGEEVHRLRIFVISKLYEFRELLTLQFMDF